ncbi:MAG: hypothetical protein R6U31_00055 [bacterium]
MKRSLFISVMIFLAIGVWSHSPSSFSIDYQDNILTVESIHSVKNPGKHFIEKLTIHLNGEPVIVQEFKAQSDSDKQQALYRIEGLAAEDKLKITAYCSISGKRVIDWSIPQEDSDED